MGRKKNPNSISNYFNEDIEKAILDYNIAKTQDEKDRLFRKIYPAISKVSEVFYNKVKPTYVDGEPLEIQMDCISYLTERLDKIKEGKGKAFSYMTVCARNYYIQQNMFAYAKVGKVVNSSQLPETFDMVDIVSDRTEEMEASADLLQAFADYLEENIELLCVMAARKSKPVIQAVIDLIRDVDNVQNFNRRDIMNSLTEINGLKIDRHYITTVFNRITTHYEIFKREWLKTGKPMKYWDKSHLTPEEIDFCIKNYTPIHRTMGIIGLAKKFGVEQYEVRKELSKVGLASI